MIPEQSHFRGTRSERATCEDTDTHAFVGDRGGTLKGVKATYPCGLRRSCWPRGRVPCWLVLWPLNRGISRGGFLSTRDRCRRGTRSHTASFTEWRGLPEVSSRALGLKEEPRGNKEPVDDRAWTRHELCGLSRRDPSTRPRGLFPSAAPVTLSAEGAATEISAEGAMLSQPTEGGTRRGAYPGGRSGSGYPNPEEGGAEWGPSLDDGLVVFYRWGGPGPSPRCSAAESLGGHYAMGAHPDPVVPPRVRAGTADRHNPPRRIAPSTVLSYKPARFCKQCIWE